MNLKNDIKKRTRYYFHDIMRDIDIDFDNILLDKKSSKIKYKNTLFYDISYKALMSANPLRISFHKIERFIKFTMKLDI